jgi:hypothetical protein
MGEDIPDVDHPPSVFDRGDEPIFVSSNVENRKDAYDIGVPKILPYLRQTGPVGALRQMVPMQQRLQGVHIPR